jgi:GNAT superfamily N-acetyltransferase
VSDSPRLTIRPAAPDDVPVLALMLEDYLRETYGAAWHGTAEALLRDGFGREMEMLVSAAGDDGRVTGFAAWTRAYDLHHCVSGGEVIDLYVAPEMRGRGVALALLSALADEVRRRGGVFIKGSAVSDAAVRKLYARFAVINPGVDCIVGGRAFRRLAELSGRPAREALRLLPELAWNYEA